MLPAREFVITQVLYYRPDRPWLLQEFLWETLDHVPRLPRVRKFLDYWVLELLAPIHSVFVSINGVVRPMRVRRELS